MGREKKDAAGGFLDGLGSILEKLAKLAEAGEELKRSGEFDVGEGGKLKGVYGFNIRTGIGQGGEGLKVEPFGNVREDRTTGKVSVHEVREPSVDVMDEEKYVLVLVEMPGIGAEDVHLELKDDILTVRGRRGDLKYEKEILLSQAFTSERMAHSCRNGVLEVRLDKEDEA